MDRIFSTADVHFRDRFAYWHEVACKSIAPHTSRPTSVVGFQAEMHAASLGRVRLLQFKTSSMAVEHGIGECRKSDNELLLCRVAGGDLFVQQAGSHLTLRETTMTLVDPHLPYEARFSENCRTLVTKIPREDLVARIGIPSGCLARPIDLSKAENCIVASFLEQLSLNSSQIDPAVRPTFENSLLDMVGIAMARQFTGSCRPSSCRGANLLRIRTAIEERLRDHDLDATAAAAAAGVSVRYANAILAEQGTSLAAFIVERRLARCKEAFDDPTQRHRTIAEIACRWGFKDMTHFARRFKDRYGESPRSYRRAQ